MSEVNHGALVTPVTDQKQEAEEREETELPKKKPKAKKDAKFKVGQMVHVKTLRDREHFKVPQDEQDPHWDPKLRNPVPDGLVDNLADFGWDQSMAALALPDGTIVHGKTRWRALEKADKKRGESIQPWVLIVDETSQEEVVHNMEKNVSLNFSQQDVDPMTKAESIYRLASAGVDDKTNAKRHNIGVNDLHGYYLILDEDKCPESVQQMLRNGQISFQAALELARKAESMTKGELTQAAEQIAKVASGGFKVTAAQVKRAAGMTEDGPATKKQIKQAILNLQSGEIKGKQGYGATWGAILAIEMCLGTRTENSFWSALGKIGQEQSIRVDFKQYISDANVGKGMEGGERASKAAEKPVKGQGKAKGGGKRKK